MHKDFYLSIIPIGEVDFEAVLRKIALSVNLKNTHPYRQERFLDSLEYKNLPRFIPNDEGILVDNKIWLRIVVNYPILDDKNDKNNKLMLAPWLDDKIIYKEAKWLGAEKIISGHVDYNIIIKDSLHEDYLNKVIDLCKQHSKRYMLVTDQDDICYKDVYNYFIKDNE